MALDEDTSRSASAHAEGAAPGGLGQSLKPRHVTMISIAGVIGAGLFVGSATAIATAGPAVLIAYAFAGTLVVLVMRMLVLSVVLAAVLAGIGLFRHRHSTPHPSLGSTAADRTP